MKKNLPRCLLPSPVGAPAARQVKGSPPARLLGGAVQPQSLRMTVPVVFVLYAAAPSGISFSAHSLSLGV